MKKLFLTLTIFLVALFASAQCNLSVQSWTNCTDSIYLTTTGGLAPYSYTISPNAGIPTSYGFYQVPSGIYTITSSDVNGCTGTVIDTVFNLTPLTVTSSIIPCCANLCNGQINLNVTGGIPPYSYYYIQNNQWMQSPSSTISNLCVGNITVYVYDASNCTSPFSNTYTIGNSNNLSLSTNIQLTPCANTGTANVLATGGVSPYSYTLTDSNGYVVSNNTGVFPNLVTGYYYIHTTDASSSLCNSIDTSIYINAYSIQLYTSATSDTCGIITPNGATITNYVYSSNSYSLSISPNAGTLSGYDFIGLPNGTYTISATDNTTGCSVTSVNTIQNTGAIAGLTATSVNSPSTCYNSTNGAIDLTVTGGPSILNYNWTGNSSGTTQDLNNVYGGQYSCLITDPATGNCNVFTTTVNSLVSNLTLITNVTQPSCSTSNGSLVFQASGGTAPYTYSLYNYNGNLVGTNSTGIFNNITNGYYTILYADINTTNCPSSDSIYIPSSTQNLFLTQNITQPTCNIPLGTAILNASGGTAPYTYTLFQPGNITTTNTTGIFNNLPIGNYVIQYNDINSVLCPSMDTFIINNPNSSAYLYLWSQNDTCGNTPLPNGAYIDCYMSINSTFTYSISPISGTQNGNSFVGLANGIYTITATDLINGCTYTATQTINSFGQIPGASVSAITSNQSCFGTNDGSIDLTITGATGSLIYNWSNGATTQDISNISNGYYSCIITDSLTGNCLTFADSIQTSGINCGYIEGIVFDDDNSNCIKDANENFLSNILITLSNGQIGYTNNSGFYSISNIPYGTYAISQTLPSSIFANACTQPSIITLNSINSNLTSIDFKDSTATVCNEGITGWSDSQFLPGGVGTYHIRYFNSTSGSSTGTISFVLPAGLTYSSATVTPTNIYPSPNGDSLVWSNINVTYATQHIYVYCNIPTTMTLGTSITSHAHIVANCVDNYQSNNNHNWTRQISAAYDPNDKSVSPFGTGTNGGITIYDNKLDYLIRFQNVGNAAAQNVIILDTISPYLDINSLHITSFSHDYTVSILNGNVLKFTFANIQLPDSISNEPGSHGHIAYDIKQKANNPIGTVINNTASIYFDYNEAVVTNTTINTIINTPLSVNPTLLNENTINMYPSPAKDYINIEFKKAEISDTKVAIYNNLGAVVYETIIEKNQLNKTINLENFTSGLYIIKLSNNEGSFNKKIFVSK